MTSPRRSSAGLPETDELHLLSAVNTLLRQRHLLAIGVTIGILVPLVFAFARARTYTTSASFVASDRKNGGLQGIATQFGIALPGQDAGQSPNFYLDLLRGRGVLGAVVDSSFSRSEHAGQKVAQLGAEFKVSDKNPARRRERTIAALRERITANVAQRTGVVSFEVTTRDPDLSKSIVQDVLDEINDFNLGRRQSQAAAERRFTTRRLDEVHGELQAAEAELLNFTKRNRDIRNSPEQQLQVERLRRTVALRQQLYVSLAQAVEQARIDEVRDTPVISVVEQPVAAVLPDGRGVLRLTMIGVLIGFLVGTIGAFVRDRAGSVEARKSEEMELRALVGALLRDLRHPWLLFVPFR